MILGLIRPVSHFVTGPAQHWANAVLGHANYLADFLVRLSFQVIHSNDAGFFGIQSQEQFLNLFAVLDTSRNFLARLVDLTNGNRFRLLHTAQPAHDDAAGNDSQIGGQRTIPSKAAEHGKVVCHEHHEDLRNQVITRGLINGKSSSFRGMVGDMHDQTKKSIHEILPGTWSPVQAPLQELAIDLGKTH